MTRGENMRLLLILALALLPACTITLRTEALPNAEQVTWQNAVTRRVNSSIICAPQEQRDCIDTVEKGGH